MLTRQIPRASKPERFLAEPLGFLAQTRERVGDLFVLREEGPILSRTPDCSGVVAAFGAQRHRAVLGDIETFGMPPSAARQLMLPDRLANLNRSLHSMHGAEHAAQKRLLMSVLDTAGALDVDAIAAAACEEVAGRWKAGATIGLLSEMRALTARLATDLLLGEGSETLAALLGEYFHLRREAASPATAANHAIREAVVAAGEAVDRVLREHVRTSRGKGLIATLRESGLSEDDVVGHANILFVSSTEPIAVALTWTLLILSQLPELRRALRAGDAALLDAVISESLRILPPNAIMVRVTSRPVSLCGVELPARCEVILSPFVAHRDAAVFPDPAVFRPSRWNEARPSSFEYFPFGAGGHVCVGRGLAVTLMKAVLSSLVARHDLVLAGDQEIDWRVHIMFMPGNDPRLLVRQPATAAEGGKLRGPVAGLLTISSAERNLP